MGRDLFVWRERTAKNAAALDKLLDAPTTRGLIANLQRLNRRGLAQALSHLRKGDCLVVWKLDRLGRRLKSLIELIEELPQARR